MFALTTGVQRQALELLPPGMSIVLVAFELVHEEVMIIIKQRFTLQLNSVIIESQN